MPTSKDTDILAPLEIWEVLLDDATIKFHEPLVLEPELLPPEEPGDRTYLTVDCPELDISAHGANRSELLSCIRGDIRFVWTHCVRFKDEELSGSNLAVKHHFLAIAEEVADG